MPVYNDGEFLEEAINSIIKQTLDEIEIVCVNDGSTDNSLDILKNFERKYDFVKVFSQENKGVAYARNLAMENATGEYLAFLDADDIFIDKDTLEKLYDVAHNNDANMVSGNIKIWNVDGSYSDFIYLKYYDKEEIILPEDYGIPFSFTKALFKREFLLKHEIVFPLLTKGEDPAFLAEVLSKLDKVYAVPTDVYAYRYIDGSLKYNNYKNYLDQVTQYKLVFDYLSDAKFDKTRHEFRNHLIGFIDMMKETGAKNTLKAIREVFADDKQTLRECEEYFYYKYRNNEELNKLVKLDKDETNPRISVVIPIFSDIENINLDSLLNQTLDDFEILMFVESYDNLPKHIDNNIHIYEINKKVNFIEEILNRVNGEFILFYNIQDKLNKNYLEELYKKIMFNAADLSLANLNETGHDDYPNLFNFKKIFKANFNKFSFDYHESKEYALSSFFVPTMSLYRKTFLEKYINEFNEVNISYFALFYYLKANFIAFSPATKYNYNFENIPNIFKNFTELTDKFVGIEKFLIEKGYFPEFEDCYHDFKLKFIFIHFDLFKSSECYDYLKEYVKKHPKCSEKLVNWFGKKYDFFSSSTLLNEYTLIKDKDKLETQNKKLLNENNKLKKEHKKLKSKNKAIINSKSWKITSPLRKIMNFKLR